MQRHRERATIVLVEGWSVLRRGIRAVLASRHQVVDEADAVADVLPTIAHDGVDLVVLGPPAAGDLAAWISYVQAASPSVPVIVLVDDISADQLGEALRIGVRGVLAKTTEDHELHDAVERVLRGERVIDQQYLPLLFSDELESPAPEEETHEDAILLTQREREVLAELAKGRTNREIAATLVVGESTVKTHLSSIYGKLEVDSRHRAVWRAIELGILQ